MAALPRRGVYPARPAPSEPGFAYEVALLTGLLAKELGGGRFAIGLSAAAGS
jgi:hypothetical protein